MRYLEHEINNKLEEQPRGRIWGAKGNITRYKMCM